MLSSSDIQTLIREGVPHADDLDLQVISSDSTTAVACVPFNTRLIRPGGTLSGPTMMALADAAMYALILAGPGRQEMAVTSNLNINFLRKPEAGKALLDRNSNPTDEEIRFALAGNLCRCTGYDKIVRAVKATAKDLREK